MSRIPNAYNWRKIDTIATPKILSVKVLILKLFLIPSTKHSNLKLSRHVHAMKANVETDMET